MIYFLKIFFKELSLLLKAKMIGYYTHIDFLPVYNWFQILKGNYEYLYKKQVTKKYPEFFKQLPLEMLFQFDKLEMDYFEKIHKLAYINALYVTTKRIDYLNQKRVVENELQKDLSIKHKDANLNDMLNLIEENNKAIGSIDVHTISTSRFYSLYYRTIDKLRGHANTEA